MKPGVKRRIKGPGVHKRAFENSAAAGPDVPRLPVYWWVNPTLLRIGLPAVYDTSRWSMLQGTYKVGPVYVYLDASGAGNRYRSGFGWSDGANEEPLSQ